MINGLFRIVKSCKDDTRASSALSVLNLNTSSLREVSYFSKRQRQTTCFFIGFKLKPVLVFPFKELFIQILWSLNVWFETSFKILPPTANIAESQRHLQVPVVLKKCNLGRLVLMKASNPALNCRDSSKSSPGLVTFWKDADKHPLEQSS